jgi:hypothetical protein
LERITARKLPLLTLSDLYARPMPSPTLARFCLALLVPALVLWSGCKRTKYTCAAYQSAFVLDMPTYKRSAAQDSMSASADTSLDVDVIAVLAERIRKTPPLRYAYDADSVPLFADNSVIKTNVLLIKRISRKRKDKMMASVPMITIFPKSADSTLNGADERDPTVAPETTSEPDPSDEPTPVQSKEAEAEKKEEVKPF